MRAIFIALALALGALPARAQTKADLEAKCDALAPDPDVTIGGCTALIQRGLESGANLGVTYNNRSAAYDAKGFHDQAIADETQAIALMPNQATPYVNRGIAYEHKGLRDQAIADYRAALSIDASSGVALAGVKRLTVATQTASDRIEASYNAAFCRPPRPEELQFWSSDPRSASLDGLVAAHRVWLKQTPTDRQAMITRSYQMEFQRSPHADEMAFWDGQVAEKGYTCADLLALHETWKKANAPSAASAVAPAQRRYMIFFDYTVAGLMAIAQENVTGIAASYRSLGATRIDLVGHTDTAEADSAMWRNEVRAAAKVCRHSRAEPVCGWPKPDAKRLGLLRAQRVADALIAQGIPASAIHVSSVGPADPLVPTAPATREPQDRRVTIDIN